jgi:hypothetical protein
VKADKRRKRKNKEGKAVSPAAGLRLNLKLLHPLSNQERSTGHRPLAAGQKLFRALLLLPAASGPLASAWKRKINALSFQPRKQ